MIEQFIADGLLVQMVTNEGKNIQELSYQHPVMLIFLRHFGCSFCREAIDDLAKRKKELESYGFRIVMVHMSEPELAEKYFQKFKFKNPVHISDPECQYYMAFGLKKGTATQLFGLHSWIRGFQSAVVEGRGFGPQLGDGFQMPGVFIISDGEIRESFIHSLSSDRPDYMELAKCCM